MRTSETRETASGTRPRVVVAGGGVAGIEGILTLRHFLKSEATIELVAPAKEFVYQPLSVAEPFGLAPRYSWTLGELADDLGVRLHARALESVDVDARQIHLSDGMVVDYNALLVTMGARRVASLPGALTFRGAADVAAMRDLLDQVQTGRWEDIAFVVPAGIGWSLPLYELALLMSAWAAEHAIIGLRLTIITPEQEPLGMFGPSAARRIRNLLADRGIVLRAGHHGAEYERGELRLIPDEALRVDQVVTLPKLQGLGIPGLPADADGFIPVDHHGAVAGCRHVYAAGDGTSFPLKQGGLALQQAGVASKTIAAALGADVEPEFFQPVVRAMLLTGLTPTFLRADISGGAGDAWDVLSQAPWSPATKIVGGRLAGYLATHPSNGDSTPSQQTSDAARGRVREMRKVGLDFADGDTAAGNVDSALQWLDVIEQLDAAETGDHDHPCGDGARRRGTERPSSL